MYNGRGRRRLWSHRGGRRVVLEVNTAKDRGGIKREKGVSEGKRRFYWRTNFRRSISVRHHSFREFIFLSTLSKGIKSTNKRPPFSSLPLFFRTFLITTDENQMFYTVEDLLFPLALFALRWKCLKRWRKLEWKGSSLCWFGIIACDYLGILSEISVFNELIFFFFFFFLFGIKVFRN